MSLEKYLDSGRLNFVDVFMRTARNFGDLQFNYKRDLGNELKKDINRILILPSNSGHAAK